MSDIIKVEEFLGTVDTATPLFARPPGWLKTLQNMRVKAGGWLEARGGIESLRPSGGTPAAVHTSGYFSGFHQFSSPNGVAIGTSTNGAGFGRDVGPRASFRIFGPATSGVTEYPVIGTNVDTANHWWAFGSADTFTRLTFNLLQGTGAGSTYSITWEYWNGAAWSALTGPTENFKFSGIRIVDWDLPTDWAPLSLVGDTANTIGGVYLYWVRARVSTIGASVQDSWNSDFKIKSDWIGHRKLFAAINGTASGGTSVHVYGQNASAVALWMLPSSASGWGVFSRNTNLSERFLDYQGTCLRVNGITQSRFDGFSWRPLGFTAPDLSASAVTPTAGPPAFGQICYFTYSMTLGYGPQGEWGESAPTPLGDAPFTATEFAALTWTFASLSDDVTRVYIYRSQDENGAPVSARGSFPAFRIATLSRGVGVGIAGFATSYNDSTYAFPFPEFPLDIMDRSMPSACRFIGELKGRVVYGANDEFPYRGWWSRAGEGEAVNQDEDYVDLKKPMTGSAVAFDTWFIWSEDEMRAISDLDEDIPNIYDVPGGVGCIAPDSVIYRYGYLFWASKDGIYRMGQDFVPERITADHGAVFGRMSFETHGGSRARCYEAMYHIHLLSRSGAPVGSSPMWRFDLVRPHWHEVTFTVSPLAVIVAPFGHADAGVEHPIFGNTNRAVADRLPYVGEYTTGDAGASYNCIADIHFGPPGFKKFSPRRFAIYYQADAGWGTPIVANPPGHTSIFKTPTGYGTPTVKSGTDYKLIVANCTESSSGADDIVVRFQAVSSAGGAVRGQRVLAAYLDGRLLNVHPTG